MAVYTRFTNQELLNFLSCYNIGDFQTITEIEQGVENSNYILTTSLGKYILTIYEKRVNVGDLPYFLSFSEYLNQNHINTPQPIRNNLQESFTDFKNKKAAIIQFLEGHNLDIPNVFQCASAGDYVAKMHLAQKDFPQTRPNTLSPSGSLWLLFDRINHDIQEKMPALYPIITQEVTFLKAHYPIDGLEKGNIHADIFPDNMFFEHNRAIGIIDFYFSCTDFLLFDLAITLCAWCFDKGIFVFEKYHALINAYQNIKPLTDIEKKLLCTLMRGAAMRFFLTRANDFIFHDKNALVKPKDPQEYYNILLFLQDNTHQAQLQDIL